MDSAFGGYKTPLQRERKLRRWKQQEVIDRIKQLAHGCGYRNTLDGFEVNALSRLENGRIGRPRDPLPELFARLYDKPEEVLFPTHGSVWGAAVQVSNQGPGGLSPPSLIEAMEGTWAKLETLAALLHPDPDMLRRQFLQLLAATGGGALLSPNGVPERRLAGQTWITALAQESAQFGHRMEATDVGSITPEQLEQEVERLARDFLTQPAAPVVAELGYLRDQTFSLLEGHQYPHQWADLNIIAAKLCGLLATASSDRFGCYDAAAKHLRTAWLCADRAGHSELKAWVWESEAPSTSGLAATSRQPTAPARAASMQAEALSRSGSAAWRLVPEAASAIETAPRKRSSSLPRPVRQSTARTRRDKSASSPSPSPTRCAARATLTCGSAIPAVSRTPGTSWRMQSACSRWAYPNSRTRTSPWRAWI